MIVRSDGAPTTAGRGGCYSMTKVGPRGRAETTEYSYRGTELRSVTRAIPATSRPRRTPTRPQHSETTPWRVIDRDALELLRQSDAPRAIAACTAELGRLG